jgi:hypothetical protein
MTLLIWTVFSVLALLWTGGAWAGAAIVQWSSELMASGQAVDLGRAMAAWPVPAWAAAFVDITLVHATLDAIAWSLESLQAAAPWAATAVGWLVPVVWVGWAFGLAALLALAGTLHWLVRRRAPRPLPG